MRTIVFARGIMGSGKSTFFKNLGLEPWVLSADNIRNLIRSPLFNENGIHLSRCEEDNNIVFKILSYCIESKMKNREFIIIDNTNIDLNLLSRYKKMCKDYRYKAYLVDFTSVDLNTCIERNKNRLYSIPENVIKDSYYKLKQDKYNQIPSWLNVIKPEEFINELNYKPIDLSHWKKIHHIGDLHGCSTVLKEYLDGYLNEDELYIFTGDYIDRGIQNKELLSILMTIANKNNVILLEGNHEINLYNYGNDLETTHYFKEKTLKSISCFDKKKLRNFYRKLRTFIYYKYYDKYVLVSHGGLTFLPKYFFNIPESQFIRGIGDYDTNVGEYWDNNSPVNHYQIHGHRNLKHLPIINGTRNFVLEGEVELGGDLRIITLDKQGFKDHYVKNNIVDKTYLTKNYNIKVDNKEFIELLRENTSIKERKLKNNISSFNFSKNTFYDKLWDFQNTKARGLFINTNTTEIVTRGYDKFFSLDEIKSYPHLLKKDNREVSIYDYLEYPINVYRKENGFLGLTGYNKEFNQPIITSKSTNIGKFAILFNDLLSKTLGNKYSQFFDYLDKNNLSAVFEVIDPINDPHYIKYNESKIILLDLIKREQIFKKESFDNLLKFANDFNLKLKKKITILNSKDELINFLDNCIISKERIEGYVLEDNNGYMLKVKLPYYLLWKKINRILEVCKNKENIFKYINNNKNSLTPLEIEILMFIYSNEDLVNKQNIQIQDKFYTIFR